MSKKKFVLSILLFVFLIIVGIILPFMWEKNHGNDTKNTETLQNTILYQSRMDRDINYIGFDDLTMFFTEHIVDDLKIDFATYLDTIGLKEETDITFLPADTYYLTADTTCLFFELSDSSVLPVYYYTSTGVFLFGKEKLQLRDYTQSHERNTSDALPSVTTDDIEALQEGGYDDSKNIESETPKEEIKQ